MKIAPILISFTIMVFISGCQSSKPIKVDPANQMVAYGSNGPGSGFIARIDIQSGQIIATHSVSVPPSIYSLNEFSDGTVGIIYCRAPGQVAKKYARLWPDGKVRPHSSPYDDPSEFFWDGKQYAIWSGASYSDPDEITWMDQHDRVVKTEVVALSAMMKGARAYDVRQNQYWVPVDTYCFQKKYKELKAVDPVNKLAKIDMKNHKVERINWPFYWTSPKIQILPSASIVLVTSLDDLRESDKSPRRIPATLFWTRYPDFKILDQTIVPGMIEEMAYVHADQKVYLRVLAARPGMKSGIAVVDVTTRKMIRFLEWDVKTIGYVDNHRLAAIVWRKASQPGRYIGSDLVLIDTQTDQVVHRLTGTFDRIGIDSAIERYERY